MVVVVADTSFPSLIDSVVEEIAPDGTSLVIVLEVPTQLEVPPDEHRSTIGYLSASTRVKIVHVTCIRQLLALLAMYRVRPCPGSLNLWRLISACGDDTRVLELVLSRLDKLGVPIRIAEEDAIRPEVSRLISLWT